MACPPVNKDMSSIPTTPDIFFCLPKSRVDLPGLNRLQRNWYNRSIKAMRTLHIRPIQGYGNTASLSYSDTWVGKPDCLHLSYTFKTAWMELTSIMLSEIPYDLTYKWNLITKTNKQAKYNQRHWNKEQTDSN